MRIRWGRVTAALASVVVGVPAALMLAWRATMPAPTEVPRHYPGPAPCGADQVLRGAVGLHADHEDAGGDADRVAAAAVLEAARCRRTEQIPTVELFQIFEVAKHGVRWIGANEAPEQAVPHLLDVWELAADQQRVGSLVNLGVWSGVQALAYEELDGLLTTPGVQLDPAVRAAARDRLLLLAATELDRREIDVREERDLWGIGLAAVQAPSMWPYFWNLPVMLVHARNGTHPIVADLEGDVKLRRIEAGVLAAALELWEGCRRPDALRHLDDTDLGLEWSEARCVVSGAHVGEIRVATATPARAAEALRTRSPR